MKDEPLIFRASPLLSFRFVFAVAFTLFFSSNSTVRAQSFPVSGVMQHSTLEGGCWYLSGNDGKQYELIGDSATIGPLLFQGIFVDMTVEPVKGGASVCMIGEIVRVIRVETVHRQPVDLPINFMILDGTVHRTKTGVWYLRMADGTQYEFQVPPAKKHRHTGTRIHARYRVLMDKKSTKERMDGVILSDAPSPKPRMAPGKKYNPQ